MLRQESSEGATDESAIASRIGGAGLLQIDRGGNKFKRLYKFSPI